MKSTIAKGLMPTLSATVFRKAAFVSCVCVCVCACLVFAVGADSMTVSNGTVSSSTLMNTLSSAIYHWQMPDGGPVSPAKIDLSVATTADGSPLGDGFDTIKYGNMPPNSLGDVSYFFALDFDTLNFDRQQVVSISLPIAFAIGFQSDVNGGFVCRLTVDDKEVGNYFDCTYSGYNDFRHDGTVLMDCMLFRSTLTYTFPAPTNTAKIGVHIIRAKDNNRPLIQPQDFLFSCGRLSYQYVSSTTTDIITPEQSQAAQEAQDNANSQADKIHGELDKLPDTEMSVPAPDVSAPKEFEVFNVFNFGDLPYIWTIVAAAFSFSGLSLILYGVKK